MTQTDGKMKRTIYLKLEVDWEDYEDVVDEILLDDVFENYKPKDGTNLKQIDLVAEYQKSKPANSNK